MAEFKLNTATGEYELVSGTNTIKPDEWTGPVNPEPTVTSTQGGFTEVEISGDNNSGPLSDLYRNPYKSTAVGYPKDLGFINRGHVIQFDIREIDPGSFELIQSAINSTKNGLEKGLDAFEKAKNGDLSGAAKDIVGGVTDAFDVLTEASDNGLAVLTNQFSGGLESFSQIKYRRETYKDKVETIRMYMPDTLNFSYGAQYDKLSLSEAINSVPLVAKVSSAITSVLENKAAKLAANKLGYTFNPQQQMLFEGIDFREFDLQFTFTPTSQSEAKAMRDIIKKLRYAAAPERLTASGGFFFIPPSVFELSFFFNGEHNTNIAPIRPCVLQNITVDYAPNGWSALRDGTPVQTTISLSFKEIELIDKNSIKDEK